MSRRKKWLAERQADPNARTVLIMAASQHPLEEGVRPGNEFERRLQAALWAGEVVKNSSEGLAVEYAVAGHRHRDKDKKGTVHTDQVALHDAAAKWYTENGVPADKIHGPEWYEGNLIYNGADELNVLARGVANTLDPNGGFCYLRGLYICSPGQRARAESYATTTGLMGEVQVPKDWVSQPDDFHTSRLQGAVLLGLSYINPQDGILRRISERSRLPADGFDHDTVPHLRDEYADLGLAWHQQPEPPQSTTGPLPAPSPA